MKDQEWLDKAASFNLGNHDIFHTGGSEHPWEVTIAKDGGGWVVHASVLGQTYYKNLYCLDGEGKWKYLEYHTFDTRDEAYTRFSKSMWLDVNDLEEYVNHDSA